MIHFQYSESNPVIKYIEAGPPRPYSLRRPSLLPQAIFIIVVIAISAWITTLNRAAIELEEQRRFCENIGLSGTYWDDDEQFCKLRSAFD